jgi:hypothetical protein
MTAQTEAKQLNIRLEKDDGEWIAILANHPDLKGDEEVGFPAPSEEEALAEARAYRSIEQSSVFKFEYDEAKDEYIVSFGDQQHRGKYLAPTYGEAQKAYAAMINEAEPPKPEAAAPKKTRQRRQPQPGVPADAPEAPPQIQAPAPLPPNSPTNITSGIGTGPGQLPPAGSVPPFAAQAAQEQSARNQATQAPPGTSAWDILAQRIDRLENVLRSLATYTAQTLEELKR